MWDDENDAELLRALEESRRLYEEVEIPRHSQRCPGTSSSSPVRSPVRNPSPPTIIDDDSFPGQSGDEEQALMQAMEESRRTYEEEEVLRLSQRCKRTSSPPTCVSNEDSMPGPSTSARGATVQDPFKKPLPLAEDSEVQNQELYDGPEAEGFSFEAGQIWVYPTSEKFPVRPYQRAIVETSLFHNTIVSLPTGLGKTFIAAVVMYNYYMWYPNGKIIFMAPTKPLVAQQIENCVNIMGIPESHTAEMTGALPSKMRAGIWKEKRVFFLTPQVVQNDLSSNICPANAVKCVVIDEAHRALGDHAYAQVIRLLNSYEARFRVLALSATPGSDLEAVQKVVSNLMISHIEMRTEESPDIAPYVHERNLEVMVVDPGPTINRIRVKLVAVTAEYAKPLQQQKLLFGSVSTMAKFSVLKEWETFRREKANTVDPASNNRINTDFSLVHTLLHGLELLQTYGLRLVLNHLKGVLEKQDPTAKRLSVNEDLRELMEEIEGVLNPIEIDGDDEGEKIKRHIYGHPKLDRLQEIVVSHFENFHKKNEATRSIVFCEYREGVVEICEMLKNFQPLVKPVAFMGQSTGKTSKGITQKRQLEIMDKFRSGVYNTLVSTSVGEEGLDIGEVDLIICFDAKNSPIRQVQRMGRTGRKRQGRIIMLVTRGKEEQKYNQGLFKKKSVRAVLVNRDNLANHLLEESPRMLPPGVQPKYTERIVVSANKKPKTNQQDLRKMFLKGTAKSGTGTSKPSTSGRVSLGKSPYLSENDLEYLQQTWETLECCQFDRIPDRVEFWAKEPDEVERCTPLANNVDLGAYVEFMRHSARTHLVSNSSDSAHLSELLAWSEDRMENDQSAFGGGGATQWTSTQLWPAKTKKRKRPAVSDSKTSNPPNKRGRPKKGAASIRHHFQTEDDGDDDGDFLDIDPVLQPAKPKGKPQFIEDDEDVSPVSSFFKPQPTKQKLPVAASAAVSFKVQSPAMMPEPDEIVLDSDDDDDFPSTCPPSGFAYLSSQPSKQELYRDLSRALRSQCDDNDEDECLVCDALFLCQSFSKLVLGRKMEGAKKTWEDVEKSLDAALVCAPLLTQEKVSESHEFDDKSPRMVSLVPKLDFAADDDTFGGVLCGGVGDMSPPRSATPPLKKFTPLQQKCKTSLPDSLPDCKNFEVESKSCVKDEMSSPCKTPKMESETQDDSFVQRHFQDENFGFLGLSKIDDIFGSQDDKLFSTPVQKQALSQRPSQPGILSEDKNNRVVTQEAVSTPLVTPGTSKESACKNEMGSAPNSLTPTKRSSTSYEQVSPILCSQAAKRPAFKFRKQPVSRQIISQNGNSGRLPGNNGDVVNACEKSVVNKAPSAAAEVSSSSQSRVANGEKNPFEIDFDMFDDSLFPLSGDGNENRGKVDDALKEAIRKKTLEAKCKQTETSFTQEIDQICQATSGGLTQIMDMFEAKEKNLNSKIERADSSSSPQLTRRSTSPIVHSDDDLNAARIDDENNGSFVGSEEDLFADCNDSLFCRVDSTVLSPSNRPPSTSDEDSSHGTVGAKTTDQPGEIPVSGRQEEPDDEVIQSSQPDRSRSPIFKASQMVRRPSKLSLKKKTGEVLKSAQQVVCENTEAFSDSSKDTALSKKNFHKISEGPDNNVQVDFSMFGDEFNNSWLLSQEDKKAIVDAKAAKTDKTTGHYNLREQVEVKNSVKQVSTTGESVERLDKDKNVVHHEVAGKAVVNVHSPETELDLAFALLDEARRQQKLSHRGASSSTPKVSKAGLQSDKKPNSVGIFAPKRNLGLKNLHLSPPKRALKEDAALKEMVESENILKPPLAESSALDLNEFCDDSLLNELYDDDLVHIKKAERGSKLSNVHNSKSTEGMERHVVNSDIETNIKKTLSLRKRNSIPIPENEAAKNTPAVSTTEKVLDVIVLSSDDESFVQNKKGKKVSLNATTSSDEGSPAIADKKRKRVFPSSSSSDSVAQSSKRAKMKKNDDAQPDNNETLDLSTFCDDTLLNGIVSDGEESRTGQVFASSDDEVFVKKIVKKPLRRQPEHTLSSDDDDDDVRSRKKVKRKKKPAKKGNGFIMNEAEESDDGLRNSSDGESTSLEELDSSFINDSQPEASQSVVDIHHKYLQSVRSPNVGVGKFKIPNNLPRMDVDVYSQYPNESELNQTYANDSFCVDNEPTQYEPEMSLLEIAEAKLKAERREKRKQKKALQYDNQPGKSRNGKSNYIESDDSEKEFPATRKHMKRLKVLEDSISDEEAVDRKETTESKTVGSPHCSNQQIQQEENNDLEDLAQLLDDDMDFSVIPDGPEMVDPPQTTSTTKFVKKTPFMLNGRVNPGGSGLKAVEGRANAQPLQSCWRKPVDPVAACNASEYSSCTSDGQRPMASTSVKASSSYPQPKVLIIASSRQISSSPDVLRILRVNFKVTIVPHYVPDADFIISWRVGAVRIFASDLKDRQKIEDLSKKLKLSYSRPYFIIEKDRVKSLGDFQKKGKKKAVSVPTVASAPNTSGLSLWSSVRTCTNAVLLHQAGLQLLFAQNFDETAGFLAKLARKESHEGHGIPELAVNVPDEVESRLQFFASLPGINYAFALKLLAKFATLSEFFSRCSSVHNIATTLGLDVNVARKIHNLLCEVHVNP